MKSAPARKWLLTVALALVAAPIVAQDWAGQGRIQGTVTDADGKPLAGAKITLHSPRDPKVGPAPLTTDKKGHWAYMGLDSGMWTVDIDLEGYVPAGGPWEVAQTGSA